MPADANHRALSRESWPGGLVPQRYISSSFCSLAPNGLDQDQTSPLGIGLTAGVTESTTHSPPDFSKVPMLAMLVLLGCFEPPATAALHEGLAVRIWLIAVGLPLLRGLPPAGAEFDAVRGGPAVGAALAIRGDRMDACRTSFSVMRQKARRAVTSPAAACRRTAPTTAPFDAQALRPPRRSFPGHNGAATQQPTLRGHPLSARH